MNKKGFTLIELLAVIVILAVIGVIVIPMMMSTINSSRSNALKASALNIVSAAENYCAKMQAEGNIITAHNYNIDETTASELNFSYNKGLKGLVSITSACKVAIEVNDGSNCALKKSDADEFTISNDVSNCNGDNVKISTEE